MVSSFAFGILAALPIALELATRLLPVLFDVEIPGRANLPIRQGGIRKLDTLQEGNARSETLSGVALAICVKNRAHNTHACTTRIELPLQPKLGRKQEAIE